MSIYGIVLLSLMILFFLSLTIQFSYHRKILFIIGEIILISLFGLQKLSVGADTQAYYDAFTNMRHTNLSSAFQYGWEKGYVTLSWLIGRIFADGRALIFIMAFFILIPIAIWIWKESMWPELSLIVFVGTGMWQASMGIFRQWCAMAILTVSYKFVKEQRFFLFLITVLVAMLFHKTAVVFILVYFLKNIPINGITMFMSIPFSVFLALAGGRILGFLNRFARISEAGNYNGGVTMLIVLWGCILLVFIFFKGKIPERIEFYYRMVYFAAVMQPIAFTFSNWSRIVMYFSLSLVIFLPNFVICATEHGKNKKFRIPLAILLCILMIVWFILQGSEPYEFFSL